MRSNRADRRRHEIVVVLLPLAWTVYYTGLAIGATAARYRPLEVAAFTAVYALLAVGLEAGARLLASGGGIAALAGGLVMTGPACWHLRELTLWPDSLPGVALLALAAALPYALLLDRLARPVRRRRNLALALGAGLGCFLSVALLAHGPNGLRWHLLRHNTMLGTPAYYLFETPVAEHQEALFAAHRGEGPDGATPLPTLPNRSPSTPRPNLVFVLLDTLRADALTAWGATDGAMPRLDRWLGDAYRFTDLWANSSWTRPSVASFMTGLLPEEHGARDIVDVLPAEHTTLAEVLGTSGYTTAAFIANVAAVGEDSGFAQGFDFFYELPGRPYARAETVTRTVERWLADPATPRRELFLYVHYLDPHEPYLAGEAPRRRSAAAYRRAYRRELAYLDRELAALWEALDARLAGPTVVLVASDHGEELFERGLFGHGHSLYQELIHVPAAVKTGDGGGTVTARLEGRDLFDLMIAVAADPELPVEAWAKQRDRERRYASLYYRREGWLILRPYLRRAVMRAIEEDGEKLIWSAYGDTWQLYDLERDPAETDNRWAESPTRRRELAGALDGMVEFWSFPERFEPSAETLEQLRALGYAN